MRLFRKILKKLNKILNKTISDLKPYIQSRNYLGFRLFYSKGTSIVDLIREKDSIYEKDTCDTLVYLIGECEKPTFIDIGSNIGLISLYILHNNPEAKIYAFDPGPHQAMLFKKTISKNNLEKSIVFNELALSDFDGVTTFCVHDSKHVSGDGFKDTGIAGDYKKISVNTLRLDEWWRNNNQPSIDLLKVDTEGAELYIFKGAIDLFRNCKPKIYFEMHPSLYKAYDYSCSEVIDFFNTINYTIHTPDHKILNTDNMNEFVTLYANYYAIPFAKA